MVLVKIFISYWNAHILAGNRTNVVINIFARNDLPNPPLPNVWQTSCEISINNIIYIFSNAVQNGIHECAESQSVDIQNVAYAIQTHPHQNTCVI
jgi:hypothetical protein